MNADDVAAHLCSSIPAMLIACKSDPDIELAISPFQGNDIGQPHQIGLVELSMQVQEGRHKMRMAFSWLLKTISKKRRESHHVLCDDGCRLMRVGGQGKTNSKLERWDCIVRILPRMCRSHTRSAGIYLHLWPRVRRQRIPWLQTWIEITNLGPSRGMSRSPSTSDKLCEMLLMTRE